MDTSRNWNRRALLFVIVLTLFITACNYPGTRSIQVTEADTIAEVYQDTPCYSGPGSSYDLMTMLKAGIDVVVIGVSQNGEYVVVQNPDNPAEHCWAALVEIITTEALMTEFMKLNVEDPDDDAMPADPMIYITVIRLDAAQSGGTEQQSAAGPANPTSTFRKRDVPVPSTRTSTPFVPPISGGSLDISFPTTTTIPLLVTIFRVNRDSICWRGPGAAYDVVHAVFAGQDVKAIGQDAKHDWYILDSPVYPGTSCWVERDTVDSPTEDIELAIIPAPLLPTGTPESGSSDGSPICYGYLPQPECEAAGGTWKGLASSPPCECN